MNPINQNKLVQLIYKYPNKWHSYIPNSETLKHVAQAMLFAPPVS